MSEKIKRGKEIINELVDILSELSDSEVGELLGTGAMNNILKAILESSKVSQYPNIAEFLLDNKNRAHLLALIRYAITNNYSFKATKNGKTGFVTPYFNQWFEDGVLYLEGKKPWIGLLGLYRNKKISYAVASREAKSGEELDQDFFNFIPVEDAKKRLRKIPLNQIKNLEAPIHKLNNLLDILEMDEAKYQSWFQKYPWALGLQYKVIQGHKAFDDKNIPD